MYGAILGDIIGEPYEFYRIKTTDFLLVGDQNRYTDDSVMTISFADGIMQNLDATDKEMKKAIITSMRRYGSEPVWSSWPWVMMMPRSLSSFSNTYV